MTRDEFMADLERRAVEAEKVGALAPVALLLRDVVREMDTVDGWPTTKAAPDEMLTLDDAAARLNVPKRWLTDHRRELPFLKEYVPGGMVRVNGRALARWLATR